MGIVEEIREDHQQIRSRIKALRAEAGDRRRAKTGYSALVELLKSHARAEEASIYELARRWPDLRPLALACSEEHEAARTLMGRISRSTTSERWRARLKVLLDMVERHISEEEATLLPALARQVDAVGDRELRKRYLRLAPPRLSEEVNGRLLPFRRDQGPAIGPEPTGVIGP